MKGRSKCTFSHLPLGNNLVSQVCWQVFFFFLPHTANCLIFFIIVVMNYVGRNILWNAMGILISYKSSLTHRSSSRSISDPCIIQKCNGSAYNPGITMTLYQAISQTHTFWLPVLVNIIIIWCQFFILTAPLKLS